jgi:hypothetical protein
VTSEVCFAQVIVSHAQMTGAIDLGTFLCLMFERIDGDLDIDRVTCGVCPGLAATWFRFQGGRR